MNDETDPSIHLPSLLDQSSPEAPADPLLAKLEAFEQNPRDLKLLAELRGAARKANRKDILAPLFEARAPLEKEPARAIQMWWEAIDARLDLGPPSAVEDCLRALLALDPGHEKAASMLAERLRAAGRLAELAHVLEAELEVLEATAAARDAATATPQPEMVRRRADRHRLLGRLWEGQLGRVDRALDHWQRAWQLEPEDPSALEAARAIYTSLGDDQMVARLYELELEAANGKPARNAELLVALGNLRARQGDARAAADHLERALGLLPDNESRMEALADQYSLLLATVAPTDRGKAAGRAVELFTELGTRRERIGDIQGAIGYWRRAIGLDPRAEPAGARLEQALERAESWEELERHHRLKMEYAAEDEDVARRLLRRGELLLDRLGQREAAKRCWEALAGNEPPGGPSWIKLRGLYAEDGDWAELAALLERELDQGPQGANRPGRAESEGVSIEGPPIDHQVDLLLELATIVREHLGDKERAAEVIHRALTLDANHPVALARYADHFREKRDWRGLADLAEFAADAAREANMPLDEQVRRLEEFAKVCELRLGDVERAIAAWRRIEGMDPDHARAKEAIRSLLARSRMWESMIGVLEKEAASAPGPKERAEALKRIAHVFRERQVDPRRAIALYEEGLQLVPDDGPALKALAELYEREGDDVGVVRTLRRQVETEAARVVATAEKEGKRAPTYKEWPQQARVERMAILRRIALISETRTHDTESVVYASTYVLELLPGDRDALERLERVLEKTGDLARLEQTLEYHAETVTGPAERAKILKRLARLSKPDDAALATQRWERVLKSSPNDEEVLAALADLYEAAGRHAELATVLERLLVTRPVPEPGSPQAAARSAELRRYATVVDAHVGDAGRALRAWQQLVTILPRDREALGALARLYEGAGEWRSLADVIARQIPLAAGEQRGRATELALQHAHLLEERLGAPDDAIVAFEALLRDVDPKNLEAHGALRRLYEGRGDFEHAVRIAEREMYLSDDAGVKAIRGLEIGLLCRNHLGDSRRALQAYERVLEAAPDHAEALAAAAELYARIGDFTKHARALERLAERSPPGRQRRGLFLRVAQVTAERLGEPAQAFAWTRRAHEEDPDPSSLAEVRRTGEAFGLWHELTAVYEAERERLRGEDHAGFIATSRELVLLFEQHLADPRRALEVLRDTVTAAPEDDGLLAEAERLPAAKGDAAQNRDLWRVALGIFEVALERAPDARRRVTLLEQRARIREERVSDAPGALEELLRAFSLDPEREPVRAEILRLAEKTGRWEDALAMEAALALRAQDVPARLKILRRTSALLEEKLVAPVRAFRVLLGGLPLAPEDADLGGELWRLARALGTYAEHDQRPKVEPAPLAVEARHPSIVSIGGGVVGGAIVGEGTARHGGVRPPPLPGSLRRDQTIQLDVNDLLEKSGVGPVPVLPGRGDPTMELQLEDLKAMAPRRDPTMELQLEDLAPMVMPPTTPAGAGKRRPPPPSPVRRAAQHVALPGLATPSRAAALEIRRYKSAWEELATAIAELPARDAGSWLKNLYRSADVWERGATDVDRAFEVLARALEAAPDDPEPRARLERLAAEHGAWPKLAALFEACAERADSPKAITGLLEDAAEVHLGHGERGLAEQVLRRILGIQPDRPGTRDRLEELLREQGRWVDLAASLEERIEDRHAGPSADAARTAFLRDLGVTYASKLGKPYEAISAYERLRTLLPGDLEALEQLAELYAQVGRWAKVTDALARVADLVEGDQPKPLHLADASRGSRPPARAREARRRIAEVYDKELELPERAIESYQAVVAQWPDDDRSYAALDQLLEQHARWEDLAEVLRRRAALAPEPTARAFFLRRRAKVYLDWLNNPEEAVANLRHARTVTPDDASLAEEMVDALASSGRAREAANVLEGRISDLERETDPARMAAPGDVAALLLRLAILRASKLDDLDGARRALDRVLDRMPDHPTALALLAKLADGAGDPRTYAEARLREAGAAVDLGAKVAALLDAGAALRDRVGDVEGARRAFAAVLDLEPANAEATWASSALSTNLGDLDGAAQVLERRLLAAEEPEERARVLTELAAIAQANGVRAIADHRLREALEAKPDHLPAIVARADLLEADARLEELEQFLQAALPRLAEASGRPVDAGGGDGQPALITIRVELGRRLAAAHERLGRDEDAYARLLEVDKVKRGDLLTKLALGENRYRARRWREAALHLSSLVDHPEAPQRAADVAEGLYHAALAEVRAMRPDRAPALYEAALRLKDDYGPALHAMAELAMEKGDVRTAASLLERQAAASPNPAEQLRLYEALGDLQLVALGDDARARSCFEQAVAAASPLESRHLPLLDKLLLRQRTAGDHLASAKTLDLMSSFEAAPAQRVARAMEAAEAYRAGGEPARARAAIDRAIEADPFGEEAVWVASELHLSIGDAEAAASALGRALIAWDAAELKSGSPPRGEAIGRRAELWRRLGDARARRGDPRGAQVAYERALEVGPRSDAATPSRRGLVAIYAADPAAGAAEVARENLRALVLADPHGPELYALARSLAVETGAGVVDEDGARIMFELAAAAGEVLTDGDRAFLGRRKGRQMAADEAYGGVLDEAERAELIADPEDGPLAEALAALWDAAPLLWGDSARALEQLGASGAERVPPVASNAAAAIYAQVAKALGAPATVLYHTPAPGAADVSVVCAAPPIVLLGPRVQATTASAWHGTVAAATDAELRFLIGRALELARPERLPAVGLPPHRFARLALALWQAFGPGRRGASVAGGAPTDLEAEAERLRKTLPVKVRVRIEAAFERQTTPPDPESYRAACERAADRAGLLVSGDPIVAVRLVGGTERASHLFRLMVRERAFAVRARLGLGDR